ncbi:MAG: histidine phosphatase family protein [Nocardioides sp.]
MRFVLIRHGQSVNNLIFEQTGGELGRHPDPLLTELGHTQAQLLAAHVSGGGLPWPVTAVYTSLMARAIQTAAPLAEGLGLPLHAHAELFECGGPYQQADDVTVAHPGSDPTELRALSDRLVLPELAEGPGWWAGPFEDQEHAYVERARRVVDDMRTAHQDADVVALVTHGWFTQYLLRELLGIPTMRGWVEVSNTGISLLRDEEGRWAGTTTAVRLNWLPHLPDHHHST